MITAHSHYQIGSSHKFCEDFALHGFNEEGGYAIVCDGCSSSGFLNGIRQPINVDFGARILSILVRQSISEMGLDFLCTENISPHPIRNKLFNVLFPKIKSIFSTMNIAYNVLDTTLLLGAMNHERGGVFCLGDGAVAIQRKDSKWEIYLIEYTENAPCYISNYLLISNLDKYLESFKDQKIVIKYFETWDFISFENEKEMEYEKTHPIFIPVFDAKKIALFSDGINTFGTEEQQKKGEKHNPIDIMAKLLDFPHIKGEFVSKRFNVINRWAQKNAVTHSDDLSVAVVGKTIEEAENGD